MHLQSITLICTLQYSALLFSPSYLVLLFLKLLHLKIDENTDQLI